VVRRPGAIFDIFTIRLSKNEKGENIEMRVKNRFLPLATIFIFSWFLGCQNAEFIQRFLNNTEEISFIVPPSGFLTPTPGTEHDVMILGLKSNQLYTLEVTAPSITNGTFMVKNFSLMTAPAGLTRLFHFETNVSTVPQVRVIEGESYTPGSIHSFQTNPLPEGFPSIQVHISEPGMMAPGITFFNVIFGNEFVDPYIIAVNASGEVIWYLELIIHELDRMANGNLLICGSPDFVAEMDMLGNIIRQVLNTDIGEPSIHHDCTELPNGNIVTMSMELRNIGPYPPDDEFFDVVGDVIVEFNWDLDIINRFSLHDSLDPFRVLPGFDDAFYDAIFGVPTKDWTHGNAVIHDPNDDTFIVSLRHQDLVVKYTKKGEMVWAIGEDHPDTTGDDDWPFITLIGPGTYPNHQHAPEFTKYGDLILYDNGNSSSVSRPVIYRIDEGNLTMTQEWEYIDPLENPPHFAPFVGDADYLENDNVLIGHMAELDSKGENYILIIEVSSISNEKVFELEVSHPLTRLFGYRAERMPSLYP